MKVAIYARVSTNGGRQDTRNQLVPLREWASRLGGKITNEYIDHASGSKGPRKALSTLLDDAHKRKFDTLLIWALDRLSREGITPMATYLERLKGYGVRVLSHQETWLDTSGPVVDLLMAVFAWVAQQERERIRERILAGLGRARKIGKVLGRPRVNYDVFRLQEMKSKGFSYRQIAQELGISPATVCRSLT